MKETIAWTAIGGAVVCLVVYFALSMSALVAAFMNAGKIARSSRSTASGNQRKALWSEIIKELPPLIDSLAKAGPAFWSLVGSMLFLLIAALAAGVFS
jgi:hypothetical protein